MNEAQSDGGDDRKFLVSLIVRDERPMNVWGFRHVPIRDICVGVLVDHLKEFVQEAIEKRYPVEAALLLRSAVTGSINGNGAWLEIHGGPGSASAAMVQWVSAAITPLSPDVDQETAEMLKLEMDINACNQAQFHEIAVQHFKRRLGVDDIYAVGDLACRYERSADGGDVRVARFYRFPVTVVHNEHPTPTPGAPYASGALPADLGRRTSAGTLGQAGECQDG